jgi:hypothetical protein
MGPEYKECMQRGYQVASDKETDNWEALCVFPDGTKCLLDDFNNKKCGTNFFTEDYCVPEGTNVWDKEKCCNGLTPYIKPFVYGHTQCQKVTNFMIIRDWTIKIIYYPLNVFIIPLLVLIIIGLIVYKKKKT